MKIFFIAIHLPCTQLPDSIPCTGKPSRHLRRIVFAAGEQKTERHPLLLIKFLMMHSVGIDDAPQITCSGFQFQYFYPAVKHDIMKQKITDTVQRDAYAGAKHKRHRAGCAVIY
jgi:hypothetical protein